MTTRIWPPLSEEEIGYWADRCKRCGAWLRPEQEDCACWYDDDFMAPPRDAFDRWLKTRTP